MSSIMTKMKKIILFTVVLMIISTMSIASADTLSITPPADILPTEATGPTTVIDIGTATTTGGEPPYDISYAPTGGFVVGITIVTWTAKNVSAVDQINNGSATAAQSVTIKDTTSPSMTIIGTNPVTVNKGDIYTDAGATATDLVDGDITGDIVTTGLPIDTSIAGTYTVTYDVSDSHGNSAQKKRNVVVKQPLDTIPPVITVLGANPITINVGDTYNDAGAIATDDVDGDITNKIKTTGLPINTNIAGIYTVKYDVSDKAGNPAQQKTRTVDVVPVIDNVPPVITILGNNPVSVFVGSAYTDAGAIATDDVDGDITKNIFINNNVNTNVIGTYSVTYDVTDKAGNPAQQKTRTVNVVPVPIKLTMTSYGPTSPVEDTVPSNIKFNITANQPANVTWSLDGVIERGILSVTEDSYRRNIDKIGSHTVIATARDGTDSVSQTWTWNVKGTLEISAHPSSINIGEPTNVTLKVSRRCGIETGDNCTGRTPSIGASISLTGIFTGSGTTNDTGLFIITINATTNGTINTTASKSGYISNSTNIISGVAPVPTSTPVPCCSGSSGGSSNSGGGGGGGGTSSAEPYENILKHESQEEFIGLNPVTFKYVTPDISVYEIAVTGNSSDDLTLRVEVLRDKSKLVSMSARGTVYKNINMWANSKRIKNAVIRYKIENSWISNSGISQSDIRMSRWDNTTRKWNELPTNVTSRDDNYTYFESTTEGFSSFAISGIRDSTPYATNGATPDNTGSPIPSNTQGSSLIDILGKRKSPVMFEIIASIIIIALAVYLLRVRKNQ